MGYRLGDQEGLVHAGSQPPLCLPPSKHLFLQFACSLTRLGNLLLTLADLLVTKKLP